MSSPTDNHAPRRRSSAPTAERFFASGVVDPATDLETVAQQVVWLRDRHRMIQHEMDTVGYRQHTTLCRAALAAIAIAQLVLLCLPWWVIDGPGSADVETAGPWTLIGLADSYPGDLMDGSWFIAAVPPMLAYVGAIVMLAVSLTTQTPRAVGVTIGPCALAGAAILYQYLFISAADAGSDEVTKTAAGLTALGLWVAAAIIGARVAADTD